MKPYRLLKQHAIYNGGEIAGFDERDAERLLKLGIIEPVEPQIKSDAPAPVTGGRKRKQKTSDEQGV